MIDNMKSCCRENNCIKCCLKTRMPLSNQDVKRIKRLGFDTEFFITLKNGWFQLKNKDGRCVFNNGFMCLIYKDRPEGCKFYPILYDKDENKAVFDKDCPYKDSFKISKRTTEELFALVLRLECERTNRKIINNSNKSRN